MLLRDIHPDTDMFEETMDNDESERVKLLSINRLDFVKLILLSLICVLPIITILIAEKVDVALVRVILSQL